ncbi:hypothetical protein LIER_21531 [Lithospermum erythrorhizon]|uniref:Uncharacterized protein n=1 Tax=Lithospermum erythrorhizon TaxID=34254 RepID=A0AAV3QWB6_LITER
MHQDLDEARVNIVRMVAGLTTGLKEGGVEWRECWVDDVWGRPDAGMEVDLGGVGGPCELDMEVMCVGLGCWLISKGR